MGSTTEDWQTIAAAHRSKQLEAIPDTWRLNEEALTKLRGDSTPDAGRLIKLQAARVSGIMSEDELHITEAYTATQLLEMMAHGKLTALEVTIAFSKCAAIAQQLTSCLTEIFFNEGVERAKWLDQFYQDYGRVVGPLHGLPVSPKDSFVVPGHHATVGYVEFLRRPVPETSSVLVNMLLDAGAVLYCKTNVPQTMMTADSENNVFGRTLHPHNTQLTAGGSSIGEGALLAFSGCVLGVGTDIAGSIRIPSLCCGTFGFKPTTGVGPVAGPMANCVEDLALFMKTVIGQLPWKLDPSVAHIPWRTTHTKNSDKLVIGLLPEDEIFKLHPPVRRALQRACSALQDMGHTVVQLPSDASRSVALGASIAFQYFGMGAGRPTYSNLACQARDSMRHGGTLQSRPHDTYGNPVYTLMWNVLDYPAATMPFGASSRDEDSEFVETEALFDANYEPEALDGMPCAIQVIAPRFQDEECLNALRIIDRDLKSCQV
ncbi:amidase signature domain-containing protein [Coniochaeta sp. 2T2.1]|nr:amidase signature domain-containing protein [Coniochaeta sp. 2T2.1]